MNIDHAGHGYHCDSGIPFVIHNILFGSCFCFGAGSLSDSRRIQRLCFDLCKQVDFLVLVTKQIQAGLAP